MEQWDGLGRQQRDGRRGAPDECYAAASVGPAFRARMSVAPRRLVICMTAADSLGFSTGLQG
jgi:hypothetical protein